MGTRTTARNWATILYPESCHPDYLDIISGFHVPAFLSPLHDHDVDKYGEVKKAHYHLMVMYEYRKSDMQFTREVVEPLLGVGAEVVQSKSGYARYLCHLDNPEKYLYDVADVKSFCGVDYNLVCRTSTSELYAVTEIISYMQAHPALTYADVVDYALEYKPEWFQVLMSYKSNFILNYYRNRPFVPKKKCDYWWYLPDCQNDVFPEESRQLGFDDV